MDAAIQLFTTLDSFAAIESLYRQNDPLKTVQLCGDLVRHFYWEKKDLNLVVALARAGIHCALTAAVAVERTDAALATDLRRAAKGLAYDLALFTWPGRDEAGIQITESDLWFGLDAARTNLRLVMELNMGDLALARAHWILGAYYLTVRRIDEARQEFEESIRCAQAAKAQADELLARGFACMVDIFESPAASLPRQRFAEVKAQLLALNDGRAYADQLMAALRALA